MTKRKAPRRFDPELWRSSFFNNPRSGSFALGVHDDETAYVFAAFVTEYVHLESAMERLFASLVGTDQDVASHISRTIISPQARIAVMRNVLERSRRNELKPDDFDHVLTEFEYVSQERNRLVHGVWETSDDTGKLYFTAARDDPLITNGSAAREFDIEEIIALRKRALALFRAIGMAVARSDESST